MTRHVAAFLQDHAAPNARIHPTQVLFNGGVFKSQLMGARLLNILNGWSDDRDKLQVLEGTQDLDHAVARGAAYYGWTKLHGGVRIRGGTARSYYIGVETAGLAVPAAPRPLQALCVIPYGMEEGTETDVPGKEIGLVVGEPARFRFFGSATRKDDKPGDVLTSWSEEELQETDPLETELLTDDAIDQPYLPVRFHSQVTELGMLQLWCVSTSIDQRWKLEFNVREQAEA